MTACELLTGSSACLFAGDTHQAGSVCGSVSTCRNRSLTPNLRRAAQQRSSYESSNTNLAVPEQLPVLPRNCCSSSGVPLELCWRFGPVARANTPLILMLCSRSLSSCTSLARRSSGCGDGACSLCQYNPSRICKRNLKAKYLIDDHLKAKCGAGLRVEVVDENGQCIVDVLPDIELEVGGGGCVGTCVHEFVCVLNCWCALAAAQ